MTTTNYPSSIQAGDLVRFPDGRNTYIVEGIDGYIAVCKNGGLFRSGPVGDLILVSRPNLAAFLHEPVTQLHVNYCAAHGHTSWEIGDEVTPFCARCGEKYVGIANHGVHVDVPAKPTPAEEAEHDAEVERSIAEHEVAIAAEHDGLDLLGTPEEVDAWLADPADQERHVEIRERAAAVVAAEPDGLDLMTTPGALDGDGQAPADDEHKRRVYVDSFESYTYAYSCSCGLRDGGYLVAPYAHDGWREAHGLDPLINYPMV
jgi:hypothetical protein